MEVNIGQAEATRTAADVQTQPTSGPQDGSKPVDPPPPYMPPMQMQPGYNQHMHTGYNPSMQPGYNPTMQPGYNPSLYNAGYNQPNDAFGRNPYMSSPPVSPQMVQPMTNVQVTQVNTGPALVMAPYRPADQTCLAIVVCIFCSPIPGLFAIFFAIKATSEFDAGNYDEGRRYHNYARYSMLASVVVAITVGVVFVIMVTSAVNIGQAEATRTAADVQTQPTSGPQDGSKPVGPPPPYMPPMQMQPGYNQPMQPGYNPSMQPGYNPSLYNAGYNQPNDAFGRNPYMSSPPVSPQMVQPMTNVQVTQVNTGPALVMAPYRPADQTCLAIAVCFFCSPIPGLFAIFFAIKATSEFDAGNYDEGRRYHNYARYSMLASVVVAITVGVVFVIMVTSAGA